MLFNAKTTFQSRALRKPFRGFRKRYRKTEQEPTQPLQASAASPPPSRPPSPQIALAPDPDAALLKELEELTKSEGCLFAKADVKYVSQLSSSAATIDELKWTLDPTTAQDEPPEALYEGSDAPEDTKGYQLMPLCQVRVAKGYEWFPFGVTGFRQTTIGECLLRALLEVQHSGLLELYDLPTKADAETREKEEALQKVLSVFDEVMLYQMPKIVKLHGRCPDRVLHLKSQIASYKVIDTNMLVYCRRTRWRQQASRRSEAGAFSSPSLRLIGVDLSLLAKQPPVSSCGDVCDSWLKLRRHKRRRLYIEDKSASRRPWQRRLLSRQDMLSLIGGP